MKQSICKIGNSLKEVMIAINAEPSGIAFITDDKDKLKGVFTDGDMRRLLLEDKKLTDIFTLDYIGEFIVGKVGEDFKALMKMTSKKVRIIPIVNDDNLIVDYFRYEHKTHFTPVAEPSLSSKELEYLTDAYTSTWISSRGKYIDQFESEFSKYCGVDFGVATSNGTVAIHLALEALGVGKGDEVIVPDLTFAATINAVLYAGATPVIVDVDVDRWTICPNAIEKAITAKTKAIIPVHVYGQPCEMDRIMDISQKHKLFVVEDCAEAHGATFKGEKVGSFGHISTFSFFANKIITTGEGGMCVTNDTELDAKMRILRDHGMSPSKRYWHDVVGYNYRMTNLQAAIGCGQLERIEEILAGRDDIEKRYKKTFIGNSFKFQSIFQNSAKVVWLICGTVPNRRDEFIEMLKGKMIDARPFFYPLSEMPIYSKYTHSNTNSVLISKIGINLPTVLDTNIEEIQEVYKTFYPN
ncbi:aminotransferase class I/II-fold pyridoxal phosphate-dependent enzyme [Crocinitomix sp.]|nr:aminotransferase class I/II-fold pyridoxal phosphate-dependent enzyme [Crocinitomix sp.]